MSIIADHIHNMYSHITYDYPQSQVIVEKYLGSKYGPLKYMYVMYMYIMYMYVMYVSHSGIIGMYM